MDQVEGASVSTTRNCGGSSLALGKSKLALRWIAGVGDLVFLPVLLLRVLRHREVCGLTLQIFRAVVVCRLLDSLAEEVKQGGYIFSRLKEQNPED